MKKLFAATVLLFFLVLISAKGQPCLPADEPPGPLVCWPDISNFNATTLGYTPNTVPPGFCGTIENNNWISFIACESSATFSIIPFNCKFNLGVQAAVYNQNLQMVSDCFSSDGIANGGEISANNLTPGEIYYFMVDGYSGDICDYNISVKSGISTTFLEFNYLNIPGYITGPGSVCAGQTVNLSLTPPTCQIQTDQINGCPLPDMSGLFDTLYHWYLPDGSYETTGNHIGVNHLTWEATTSGTISVFVELIPRVVVCSPESCFPWLNENGCDLEVQPFQLTVRAPDIITLPNIEICAGSCAFFRGQTYCDAGDYSVVINSEDGCDTTFLFSLSFISSTSFNLGKQQLCAGECFDFNGTAYCDAGWYEVTLAGANGCDSIVNFEVEILAKQETTLPTVKICQGDCYQTENQTFCNPGIYQFAYTDQNGCDSIVKFKLEVYEKQETVLPPVKICRGNCYRIEGQTFCEPGTYRLTHENQYGCDSVVVFQLEILQPAVTELPAQTICEGECIEKDGRSLCQSGRYGFTYAAANGCDSVVWLDLTVSKPKVTHLPAVLLCKNECYDLNGIQYCSEGKYRINQKDRFGCDSTVIFELFIRNLAVETPEYEVLTPENSSVELNATLTGKPENVVFNWQKDREATILSTTPKLRVSAAGKYILTVTDTLRGCVAKDTTDVAEWKVACRENEPTPPGKTCAYAPFLCGEFLNGYCTTLQTNTEPQPAGLLSKINRQLENPHWLKWSPCESEVIFEFASANCTQQKGMEIFILRTDDCEQFDILSQSLILQSSDIQELSVNNLDPGAVYYLVADGVGGDFCQLKIAVKKGINLEPLELVQISGGYIRGPASVCPGEVITLSIVPPTCAIRSSDGCAFPLDRLDYASGEAVWDLPSGAQILTEPGSSWIQIQFPANALLPENIADMEGQLTWQKEIRAEIPVSIKMPHGMFCNLEGTCGIIQDFQLEISHEVVQLPPVKICENDCYDFCGRNYCETSKAICREDCRTVVQEIQVEEPQKLDYGTVEICQGKCFTLPASGTLLCEPGTYRLPTGDDCGTEEIVTIKYYDLRPVSIGPITEICDALHSSYNISFDILDGVAPFKVNGTQLRDNHFVSQRIPNSTPFHFEIADASVCILKKEVFGSYDCGPLCISEAGTMEDLTLQVCEDQTALGKHLADHQMDADDAFDFVLHTNSENELGEVLAQNENGAFHFLPDKMEYGKPYYISFVVGNKVNGKVDLNDQCLSVAPGQPVIFKQSPVTQIAENQSLTCKEPQIELWIKLSSPTATCQWIDPDNIPHHQSSIVASKAGAYRCIATSPNGCSFEKTVLVSDDRIYPVADAGVSREMNCDQTSLRLDGSGSSAGAEFSYEWTTDGGYIQSGANTPQPLVASAALYFLTVKNKNNGCTATDTVEVTQSKSAPKDIKINLTTPVCHGEQNGEINILEVSGGMPPYLFSFDEAPFSANAHFRRLQSGVYKIEIKDAHNCRLSREIVLTESPSVKVELGDDIFVKLGEPVTLTAASTITPAKIKWWNDLGDTQNGGTNWTHVPSATSRHYVRIEDNAGCSDADEVQVYVQGSTIYVPSAFSPNGDHQNDRFIIYAGDNVKKVKSIRIFDRRGGVVFERLNTLPGVEADGWDGTFRNKVLQPDVFAYVVEIEFLNGDVEVFKGDVTLMR